MLHRFVTSLLTVLLYLPSISLSGSLGVVSQCGKIPCISTVLALIPLISSFVAVDPAIVLFPQPTLGELGTPFP
ncbi:hypothetical protein EV401DRAFT_1960899 [Pisolithus croceorrhizus]|nr:hypothetical protein EV401DRAFT_1960899 [Pisolithus croceorrhizus]